MTVIERERQADVQVDERERRASVLESAAWEIDVRGWCQGQSMDDYGRVCMIGGIFYADTSEVTVVDAHKIFFGHYTPGDPSLDEWNDVCPDRTAAEVCFVLRWRAQEIRDGR